MSADFFQAAKSRLQPRIADIVQALLPGGRVVGKEYCCASIQGGSGQSCRTNLETGIGSDFATGETWQDVIALAAKVLNLNQYEAAKELEARYAVANHCLDLSVMRHSECAHQPVFAPILPVPQYAPKTPSEHPQHGQWSIKWGYTDAQGKTLCYVMRFDLADGRKVVLPLCYGRMGLGSPQWAWKALPAPRPLYGLQNLAAMPNAPVLIVEGEKAADAAQAIFPAYAVTTWSGGAMAVDKTDFSPLVGRCVVIWPDNDDPGFTAALAVASKLERIAQLTSIVLPPDSLPSGWDLADESPDAPLQALMDRALSPRQFREAIGARSGSVEPLAAGSGLSSELTEEMNLKAWPVFSWNACPGLLGDFVRLAAKDSEADPAAIAITTLVRFCAEIYGYAPNAGPHIYVGETVHPPRLFAVICGSSSKARKGTSRKPVEKLFGRMFCAAADLQKWQLGLPARESGGPLSTGEGLAFFVRDESDEERERWHKQHPNEPVRSKDDKRLVIFDEEFASALACTKREGNTLSSCIRSFWDSGAYSPLTKNNPVVVQRAHINILTHITIQELLVRLGDVQVVNGFGNRFLWVCARRSKMIPLPAQMPEAEIAPLQRELWQIVAHAQKRGAMTMASNAVELWKNVYSDLSKEHFGLAGSIINRAEAQTLRLSLVYALLDGKAQIEETHLQAALAMWQYAQDSALYIFGDRAVDPLEEKVLGILRQGPLTSTELSAALNRNIPKARLEPLLQQLETQQRIIIRKEKRGPTRFTQIISLNGQNETNELYETLPSCKGQA